VSERLLILSGLVLMIGAIVFVQCRP